MAHEHDWIDVTTLCGSGRVEVCGICGAQRQMPHNDPRADWNGAAPGEQFVNLRVYRSDPQDARNWKTITI